MSRSHVSPSRDAHEIQRPRVAVGEREDHRLHQLEVGLPVLDELHVALNERLLLLGDGVDLPLHDAVRDVVDRRTQVSGGVALVVRGLRQKVDGSGWAGHRDPLRKLGDVGDRSLGGDALRPPHQRTGLVQNLPDRRHGGELARVVPLVAVLRIAVRPDVHRRSHSASVRRSSLTCSGTSAQRRSMSRC